MPGSPPPQPAVPLDQGGRVPADEDRWRDLLLLIESGRVVPVVGQELLVVDGPEGPVNLRAWMAARLAEALKVEFDPAHQGDPLSAVACRYLATNHDERPIYLHLYRIHQQLPALGLPPSLRRLAAIEPFKLFVTTNFDDSLSRAIDAERAGGRPVTEARAYTPTPDDRQDLSGPIEDLRRPMVFHLLGKASPHPNYVVTEEDALEFVYSLLSPGKPARLFSELYRKDVLVIGCRFPAWLVRFFIRLSRQERLRLAQGHSVFVVDTGARGDRALIEFLRAYKTRTEVIEHQDPIGFVNELHDRWQAAHPRRAGTRSAPAARSDITPGAIFLSYASEDRDVVEALAERLDKGGLDVWFDRHQLMVGDDFEDRIRDNIDKCRLFLPILSRHCLDPNDRFFRLEWKQAVRRSDKLPPSRRFIIPVAIDDVPPDSDEIDYDIRRLHRWSLDSGLSLQAGISDGFVSAVQRLYRESQDAWSHG